MVLKNYMAKTAFFLRYIVNYFPAQYEKARKYLSLIQRIFPDFFVLRKVFAQAKTMTKSVEKY